MAGLGAGGASAARGAERGGSREEDAEAALVGLVIEEDLSALDLSCSDQLKPSPLLPVPALASRRALAPKLKRLPKVELGEPLGGASPSSIALSSIDPLPLLDELSARFRAKMEDVGEPPETRAEMEVRRRCWAWALAAAVAIGPG